MPPVSRMAPSFPPLPGSPALNAGTDAATNFLLTDQRGLPRLSGAHVDIGAVEAQYAPATNPPVLAEYRLVLRRWRRRRQLPIHDQQRVRRRFHRAELPERGPAFDQLDRAGRGDANHARPVSIHPRRSDQPVPVLPRRFTLTLQTCLRLAHHFQLFGQEFGRFGEI